MLKDKFLFYKKNSKYTQQRCSINQNKEKLSFNSFHENSSIFSNLFDNKINGQFNGISQSSINIPNFLLKKSIDQCESMKDFPISANNYFRNIKDKKTKNEKSSSTFIKEKFKFRKSLSQINQISNFSLNLQTKNTLFNQKSNQSYRQEQNNTTTNKKYQKVQYLKVDQKQNKSINYLQHRRHPSSYSYLHQQSFNTKYTQNYEKKPKSTSMYFSDQLKINILPQFIHNDQQIQFTARFPQIQQTKYENNSRKLSLSQFLLGPLKDKGKFGNVSLAIDKKTGFILALKEIPLKSNQNMIKQLIEQIKIQMFIIHPLIVQLYGFFFENGNLYLLMQFMQEGNLYQYIKKKKSICQNQSAIKLQQICRGLQYLHQFNIIHRDIKPENIVITFNSCKICDFSWAVHTKNRRKTNCGTLDYLSPEIIQGKFYDSSIDLWSIGVLLYEMLTGKPPFFNRSLKQTLNQIKQCKLTIPEFLSQNAKYLIKSLLRKNPEQRIQLNRIMDHAFFQNIHY